MIMRYSPGKPKVQKRNGQWQVFVPMVVFGNEASGSHHGPFPCWEIAFSAAKAIAGATLVNVTAINTYPMQIASVN